MKQRISFILLITIICFSWVQSMGQISYGGTPYSFEHQLSKPTFVQPDQSELQYVQREAYKDCSALEFGRFLPLSIDLQHDAWTVTTLPNGGQIYQLGIQSQGALAIGANFRDFYLPEGAQLFIYSPDSKEYIGSFTHLNNSKEAMFATEILQGEELVIEYYEPKNVMGQGHFVITEILHAYIDIQNDNEEKDFGDSGYCEVNVNCPEGENHKNQRDAVLRIMIKSGSSAYWCSGALINNTSLDRTPYVITADHCGKNASDEDMLLWLFYFHYQFYSCWNPDQEPTKRSLRGCEKIAASSNAGMQGSDFFLVKLTRDIPEEYHPYFLGWSRETDGLQQGYSIHHPWGDVKKISTYTQALADGTINGGTENGYWEVFWSETESGHGVTEPGSSGSPIFNVDGNLVGTLTGGQASCSESGLYAPDYYGKFIYHWDQNGNEENQKLEPWLDPAGTDVLYLDGIYMGYEELKLEQESRVRILPNPAKDRIQIQLPDSFENAWVHIYDIQGHLVQEMQIHHTTSKNYSVKHLKKGVYMLKAMNAIDNQIVKFVVQ